MKNKKRSPLKDDPLRNPGQSLEEQLRDQIFDRVLPLFTVALVLTLLAGYEWLNYFNPRPANPILFSIVAGVAIAYTAVKVWRALPQIRALKQGRDGEKAVGQFLEQLREKGFKVLHDVVGDGFNIDHVLVGPAGVFTIETKTISKPARGEAKITFDGQALSVAGYQPSRDPVTQAKAQARWLKDVIKESTGRTVRIWPVVVYPGWFVESSQQNPPELWVLNPRGLPSFLSNEPVRLSPEDVNLVNYHLSRYVRQKQKE